ncbi:MAG: hypothetical protein ASARMPREDX12_007151 [Alectoria sarmentosa]|nr:MAG: hypothetical protein ASARMPREDX12_007151 [Alectoria sarmentosa]
MLSVDKSGKGKIKLTIVTSGDSYSSTDFNPKKEQPSPTNPFGNPPLPESSSIDQKWIHYLTMTYNSSVIQTYNMANYGATMDGFVRFYHEHFMPHYGISNHTGAARWNATNSLFTTFFGINDVRRCTDQPLTKDDCSEIFESLFAIYAFLLEQLYLTGARNFLILNIPPLDLMPFSRKWGHPVPPRAVSDWNARLAYLASSLTHVHPDVTVFQFDTHALFTKVIDDPKSYQQTAIYKNTADNCEEYKAASKKNDFDEVCGMELENYLWHDALHPTTAVHEAMAAQVAQMLEGVHGGEDNGQKEGG